MLTIVLRFAHVGFGALWVGMMAFQVFFLMPALMPIFGLITLVSGMWLFSRMSGGNIGALMQTAMGKAFGFGGLIALLAFLIGVIVMRPAMMRTAQLSESLPSTPPADRPAVQ